MAFLLKVAYFQDLFQFPFYFVHLQKLQNKSMIKSFQKVLYYVFRTHHYNFESAVEDMKKTGQFVNKQLMENQKLQLWALYMQATQGDAKEGQLKDNNNQPNVTQTREELNKFEAWKKYIGKPKQQAQQDYIKIVKQLLEKHGSKKKDQI